MGYVSSLENLTNLRGGGLLFLADICALQRFEPWSYGVAVLIRYRYAFHSKGVNYDEPEGIPDEWDICDDAISDSEVERTARA
jgi:hypothetical protein